MLLLVSPPVAAIVCESVFLLLDCQPSFNQPFFDEAFLGPAVIIKLTKEADLKHDEDNDEDWVSGRPQLRLCQRVPRAGPRHGSCRSSQLTRGSPAELSSSPERA